MNASPPPSITPAAEPVGILADGEEDLTLFAFDDATTRETGPAAISPMAAPPDAASSAAPPPAPLAGRYLIGDLIGRGGLCDVFAASDTLAVPYAPALVVKRLRVEHRSNAEAVRELKAQAELLARLSHPNIVRFVAAGHEQGDPWLVMERITGASLGQRLRQSAGSGLGGEAVATLLSDLIAALRHIHGKGLVHGDLKPGNILIGDDGHAFLLDPLPPAQSEAQPITPLYASPERAAGRQPAIADDVYALALVAYEAMTGRHPFGRIPPAEALTARRRLPARPAELDRAQWRFLSRLLTGNTRWTTAVTEFTRLTRPARQRADRRDKRWSRLPIAALLLLAVLGGASAIKLLF
ncbi:serine/threonine protein kinase (plasmid) [Azospirillum sp. B510]|uniref:serine/threonine-protein kinase n=1 Tax=Azospirillum sp. (strain B510) TaxID=137722 RepID=UPI0001C4BC71|nr:serine/threonine-protein kinase [Azospirillum sp. B510]BAI74039.1 serine/threonine protein kinase [Azospirillum sp. B510]